MKKLSLSALAAVGVLAGVTGANAADLGGNCCADLEERIAELEATTARKGNRKVSLTISGWVAEQVTYFDDGIEKNAYVTGIGGTIASHVKFSGKAQIAPGLSAGYVLHIEANTSDPYNVHQNRDDAPSAYSGGAANSLSVFESYWFVKSDTLGSVSVGQRSSASDNTAIVVDGSGSLIAANYVHFDGAGFFLRSNKSKTVAGAVDTFNFGSISNCATTSGAIAGDCGAGVPSNNVRYDSPAFAGFSASASWGEDKFWDVAGRWAGELGPFKIAAATAYFKNTDESNLSAANLVKRDAASWQSGLYVQHSPTGLFGYGAYIKNYDDNTYLTARQNANMQDADTIYLKGGLRQKFNSLGNTVFYGEYQRDKNAMSAALANTGFRSSEMTTWGVGVVQEIDAAAMSIWLKYRNLSGEIANCDGLAACGGAVGAKTDLDSLHIVTFGGMISF